MQNVLIRLQRSKGVSRLEMRNLRGLHETKKMKGMGLRWFYYL